MLAPTALAVGAVGPQHSHSGACTSDFLLVLMNQQRGVDRWEDALVTLAQVPVACGAEAADLVGVPLLSVQYVVLASTTKRLRKKEVGPGTRSRCSSDAWRLGHLAGAPIWALQIHVHRTEWCGRHVKYVFITLTKDTSKYLQVFL